MRDKITFTKEQVEILEKVFNYAFNHLEQIEQGENIIFVENGKGGFEKFDAKKEYNMIEDFANTINERLKIVGE